MNLHQYPVFFWLRHRCIQQCRLPHSRNCGPLHGCHCKSPPYWCMLIIAELLVTAARKNPRYDPGQPEPQGVHSCRHELERVQGLGSPMDSNGAKETMLDGVPMIRVLMTRPFYSINILPGSELREEL